MEPELERLEVEGKRWIMEQKWGHRGSNAGPSEYAKRFSLLLSQLSYAPDECSVSASERAHQTRQLCEAKTKARRRKPQPLGPVFEGCSAKER